MPTIKKQQQLSTSDEQYLKVMSTRNKLKKKKKTWHRTWGMNLTLQLIRLLFTEIQITQELEFSESQWQQLLWCEESKFEILGSNHVECGYGVRREVQQFWRLVKNYKTACVREGVHMKIILPNTDFQASENCPNSFLP